MKYRMKHETYKGKSVLIAGLESREPLDFNFPFPKSFLALAVYRARNSPHAKPFKMGSVIFKRAKIISSGFNSYNDSVITKLSPCFYKYPGAIHAEMDSILRAKEAVCGCSMLVVRINGKGNFRMAKPCYYCQDLLHHVKIKKVFYSNGKETIFDSIVM